MPSPMDLIDRYLEGSLSAEEFARLAAWIEADDAQAIEFTRQVALHVDLHAYLQSGEGLEPQVEAAPPRHGRVSSRLWTTGVQFFTRPTPLSWTVAALVMGLLIGGMALIAPLRYEESVARVTRILDPVWSSGEPGLFAGDFLRDGDRIRLESGLIEVAFASGSLVVLEGPCALTLCSKNACLLGQGKLAARVPPRGIGFTVETPTTHVVDLGTEFGLLVAPDGGRTEIHVLVGSVEARPLRGDSSVKPHRLTANQAIAIETVVGQSSSSSQVLVKEHPMNRSMFLSLVAAVGLAATAPAANASPILIDFGLNTQTTPGNWNNASAASSNSPNNIANLIDSTGATTGIRMTYGASGGASGVAGSGANYLGPYPAAVNTMPATALEDGLFINNGVSITLTFTGLNPALTYDFLAYGARGNNGVATTYTINGATSQDGTISNVFENATETVNLTGIAPNGSNTITFVVTHGDSGSGALNVIQITAVPEPSSSLSLVALLAAPLLGSGYWARRRKGLTPHEPEWSHRFCGRGGFSYLTRRNCGCA